MKNKTLILISFFILILSILIKTYLNLYYDSINTALILDYFDISVLILLITLIIVNIFIIFISAFGTNVFLNVSDYINKQGVLKNTNRKTKIYLLYFIIYSMYNFLVALYSIITQRAMGVFYVNIISLIFFGLLSCLIYYIEDEYTVKKQNLINAILIFILNGIISIIYILKR